jgi:endonuclease/exonuclease/phosphatase family metal-dependent hydrolase
MSMHPTAGAGAVIQSDRLEGHPAAGHAPPATGSLRVMSYNIQGGIETTLYRHYVTRGWRHILPDAERQGNLNRIAQLAAEYDLVGLQEVDAGSFRSGFINQVEYLARQSKFPCWYSQTNRNLGKFAQHSNGILSRFRPFEVSEHKLPGMIPGRGALLMRFGSSEMSLDVVIVHLALGQRTRMRQLDYVGELLGDSRHAIVMGDFNCRSHSVEIERLCARGDLCEPLHDLHTFPSWRPQANIDHILVSPSLTVEHAEVLDHPLSDHLPVVMRVGLPEHLKLLPWPHLAAAV